MSEPTPTPTGTMPDPLVLPLIKEIIGHEVIREVKLRRPKASEILRHGMPYTVTHNATGAPMLVELDEAIAAYAEICIDTGTQDHLAIMSGLSMADTLALRERVIGFFLEAVTATKTSAG